MFSFVAPEDVGRRARADPRDRGVDPAGAGDPLPRRQHRRRRPRRVRREEVRLRGVAARAGPLPRADVVLEHDRLPGAPPGDPLPPEGREEAGDAAHAQRHRRRGRAHADRAAGERPAGRRLDRDPARARRRRARRRRSPRRVTSPPAIRLRAPRRKPCGGARRAVAAGLAGVTGYDLLQRRHAILRNFPIVGHLRYLLETFGPELRQYIVTGNDEERPFSRDQRRWVYASAKRQANTFGFGTDNEMESVDGDARRSSTRRSRSRRRRTACRAATRTTRSPPARCSAPRAGARHAFRPRSLVNISGMSFGALSGPAVRGAQPRLPRSPAACRTPARAGSRRTTARAASSSSRSAPATSAAATSAGASRSPHLQRDDRRTRRCGRSRSSSRRARSRASAGCCRRRR